MKLHSKLVAALVATFAATAAHATVLNFNNLSKEYGDGFALGPNITSTGKVLTYTENGYVFTLYASNSAFTNGAHIGDAGVTKTFNWHDAGDNGVGAYVVLTAANGGLFNLAGFNYVNNGTGLTVSAAGYNNLVLTGSGSSTANFLNVSSIKFSSNNYSNNQLDNVTVTAAVPEPGSLALIGLGLAGAGLVRRKRAAK